MHPTSAPDLAVRVVPSRELSPVERSQLHDLFDGSYRNADHEYLDGSLGLLANVAFAEGDQGAVGFALGELRSIDIPRLGPQVAALAGLCCIAEEFRRQGLFRRLEVATMNASDLNVTDRVLTAGRMAHPASFRIMSGSEHTVPRLGSRPTAWQQEVGAAVAAAYRVREFDPETFVCRGRGRAIGEPILELEVESWERDLFARLDRSRGDSLLGISWMPDAPPGW